MPGGDATPLEKNHILTYIGFLRSARCYSSLGLIILVNELLVLLVREFPLDIQIELCDENRTIVDILFRSTQGR